MAVRKREEAILLEPVRDALGLKAFIDLPNRLYRGQPNYVVPLALERREALDTRKNAYFRHAEGQYWLAWRDGRPVGRISAQIDQLHLARHGATTGHFGLLDAEDDPAVFDALLGAAEIWLKERGMTRIQGPFNLSINEETGLLVDGFDHPAMLMMGFSQPFAGRYLEAKGYSKAKDVFAYNLDLAAKNTVKGHKLLDRMTADGRVRVRPINKRRYRAELDVILEIFNETWEHKWNFIPFTPEEMRQVAAAMRPLVRPGLNYVALVDDEPAAMIICLPNLYEAIEDLDGRLLPFGWAKLLWRLKTMPFKSCRVPLMGIRPRYHRSVLGSALLMLLFRSLHQGLLKDGFERVEMSWILEDDMAMRRLVEDMGATAYKTYRVYEKAIA